MKLARFSYCETKNRINLTKGRNGQLKTVECARVKCMDKNKYTPTMTKQERLDRIFKTIVDNFLLM